MRIVTVFILFLSVFASASTLAQDKPKKIKKARWYQVNLTVFKQKPDRKLDESFAFQPIALDMANVVQLKKQLAESKAESAIDSPSALHFEAINTDAPYVEQSIDDDWSVVIDKLDPAKQPILYNVQWVQPVYSQKHHIPLYFESSQTHMNQPELKGIMDLHVARYLHAKFHLSYLPETADSYEDMISLQSARRMRSKEVHYLDHPLVGVLLRMLPVESPIVRQEKALEAQQKAATSSNG